MNHADHHHKTLSKEKTFPREVRTVIKKYITSLLNPTDKGNRGFSEIFCF